MKIFYVLGLAATILVVSCKPDNEARLDALIKKRDKINEQIATLKDELNHDESAVAGDKALIVKAEKPVFGTFKHFVEVQGTVQSDNNVFVPAQSMGIVTKIYVQEGASVRKGQLMAETDGSILEKSIEQLNNAYKLAKDVYERQARLWEKKIGSEIQYLQAKNNKENLEKQLEALREQYKLTKLYSPIDGTVDQVNLKVGEGAAMGGIRVIQLSNLYLEISLSESYVNAIHKGDSVQVEFPSVGIRANEAVKSVSRYIDPGSRTFTVKVDLKDIQSNVVPNMLAVVKINDYKNDEVIILPQNIVQKDENEHFVFKAVEKDGKLVAQKQLVKAGNDYNNRIEILKGIQPDDDVITVGYQGLSDGRKISF